MQARHFLPETHGPFKNAATGRVVHLLSSAPQAYENVLDMGGNRCSSDSAVLALPDEGRSPRPARRSPRNAHRVGQWIRRVTNVVTELRGAYNARGDDAMPKHKAAAVAGGGRICFRGDTRDPAEMFKQGFFSKDSGSEITTPRVEYNALPIKQAHKKFYEKQGFKVTTPREVLILRNKRGEIKDKSIGDIENLEMLTPEGLKNLKQFPLDLPIALVPRGRDIVTPTAVCVTPRFSMAVLFPPKESKHKPVAIKTWIYVLYVRNLFNTHGMQCTEGLEAIRNELEVRQEIASAGLGQALSKSQGLLDVHASNVALWPLYAQELATKSVEAKDVICAVKVHRDWNGDDWTYGCSYDIWKSSLLMNESCTLDGVKKDDRDKLIEAVKEFINNEPKTGQTPSRSSGFYKDTEEFRNSINTVPQNQV
jgi:hypothetical protein